MLIELLRRAAGEVGGEPVVVVSGSGTLTYRECLPRAEALARGLERRELERFGCLVDDAGSLLALLAGSSLVGSEACVYPPESDADEVAGNAAAFAHPVVVTDRPSAAGAPAALQLDALTDPEGEPPAPASRAPVLILTTGTTGHRRGARHDWSRLVAAATHTDEQAGTRWLLAYNLNQFAGLQILLHVLASRGTLVVPPSPRPVDVAAAIRDEGVTHVSATPTFWRLLAGTLDHAGARELPLRQITLGGEAVPDALIARLRSLWPQARISQVYGATEFGLAISVRDGRSGLPRSLLERGEDAPVQVKIEDGELWVRSRVGMLGYHGQEVADEGWRRTGDLVELRGDRIHFVGRASEVINVGGVKVHPVPIEEAVSAVEGVELVHAYGRPNPVTGHIVAVDVVAAPEGDREALEAQIRSACESLPRPARPRRIRFVESLEVRGHKLARRRRADDR